jgi:hypothetical protein
MQKPSLFSLKRNFQRSSLKLKSIIQESCLSNFNRTRGKILCMHDFFKSTPVYSTSFFSDNFYPPEEKTSKFDQHLIYSIYSAIKSRTSSNILHHKVLTYVEYRAVSGVFQNIDPPLSIQRVCPPTAPKAEGYTLARRWGGGGSISILWKSPDVGLASYSIISLRYYIYDPNNWLVTAFKETVCTVHFTRYVY